MSSWGHQEGNKLMQRRDPVDSGTTTGVQDEGGGGAATLRCFFSSSNGHIPAKK